MSHYPPIEEIISIKNSQKLLEVYRSVLSILSVIFWFLATSSIALFLLVYFGDVKLMKMISLHWLLVIPGIQLLEILRRYHDNLYIFYKDKITHLGGRLSLQYSVPDVKYIDIRAINIQQDIPGRIFNYGTIEINTAATDSGEILIEGVRAPYELAQIIEFFRTNSIT